MSHADVLFKRTCNTILNSGVTTEGQKVRPHWEDGTPAYTLKAFGVVNEYDLRKEFPAITLRRVALKTAMDEILWIYQRKSNRLSDLNAHIWDEWKQEDGTIGTCYGWTIGHKFPYKGGMIDQMDYVLTQLKEQPYSRRIMTNLYQFDYLEGGALDPCAYSMTYNVTEENGQMVLNAILNQRSQDVLAANAWNVSQYAILLMMVGQVSGMIPGRLIHVIADAHIYDRHVPMIKTLLDRKEYSAPKVTLNPEVKNFYDFTTDDLIVQDYQYGEQIKNIPIAV